MSLVDQTFEHFSNNARSRGDQYFFGGSVQIVSQSDDQVTAIVSGGGDYEVRLILDADALFVSCTCPYYESNVAPCKHVWATIRAADTRGSLRAAGQAGPLRVLTDSDAPSEWDRGGEGEFDGDPFVDDDDRDEPRRSAKSRIWGPARVHARRPMQLQPTWKDHIEGVGAAMRQWESRPREVWPAGREILYIIDHTATLAGSGLVLEIAARDRKMNGEWAKLKSQRIPTAQIPHLPDCADRQILSLLRGARVQADSYYGSYNYDYGSLERRYTLADPLRDALVPMLCQTGRCHLRTSGNPSELLPLGWDDGDAWEFWLEVAPDTSDGQWSVSGSVRRGDERVPLREPILLVHGGMVFFRDRIARLDDRGAFAWISLLRGIDTLWVPAEREHDLIERLLTLPRSPNLDLPESLRFEEVTCAPRFQLKVRKRPNSYSQYDRLLAELAFDYEGIVVPAHDATRGVYDTARRRRVVRDARSEGAAFELLRRLGFRETWQRDGDRELELTPRHLPRAVRTLVAAGWHVEAEGKLYRVPGQFRIEVTSGVDWFELHGDVQFGDSTAKLPELLAALKRGDNIVQLGNGTFGMLPEEWLKKYGLLAGLGTAAGDHLQFSRSQVGLLDALLAAQPEATCDAVFTRLRDELRAFDGIAPAEPNGGFVGQLRDYQKIGLGWFDFLQKFGFGGCLADDMGLGKTVQVLALLESRRRLRATDATSRATDAPGSSATSSLPSPRGGAGPEAGGRRRSSRKNQTSGLPVATNPTGGSPVTTNTRPGPSLVVVPKSLVFNWKQEAARFTPALRVLDHTGITRVKGTEHFDDYDLVLTTYGTLRRDAIHFKDVEFDFVILDEAQAIKNANTESAKAARLLRGRHRLGLSGTPIENHLGELWSLFEFLNPGMLGTASVFRLGGAGARSPDADTRQLLARALRPFILRRTKDQVAKELPAKLEQTLYCELEPTQRKLYDELRDHYRRALLTRVARDGINKSKIQILEALLRLRQAAIHPGLIDRARAAEPSAKLDLLLPQLAEVLDEGHKALVFSQFTTMLGILRDRLDAEKIVYEYLDGKTRDRGARVERFQTDPNCKLFLVSLKAGGLGLNLTAAEYVFLLDPWWNPAVEAQAIDRTHRIGQTRQVFAYRLIARDTVEEKILALQDSKRSLADAIINADNSLIRNLSREDLELLLS